MVAAKQNATAGGYDSRMDNGGARTRKHLRLVQHHDDNNTQVSTFFTSLIYNRTQQLGTYGTLLISVLPAWFCTVLIWSFC